MKHLRAIQQQSTNQQFNQQQQQQYQQSKPQQQFQQNAQRQQQQQPGPGGPLRQLQNMNRQQQEYEELAEDMDDELMDDEEIGYVILELGNDILRMLGVEQPVDDVGVFFNDAFYLQYFDAAFPDLDFSELQPGNTDEAVGENIQALIDLLAEEIMRGANLQHISGLEIACGNPDHCLELLQIIHQVTVMMAEQDAAEEEAEMRAAAAAGGQLPNSDTSPGEDTQSPDSGLKQKLASEGGMEDDDYGEEDDSELKMMKGMATKQQHQEEEDMEDEYDDEEEEEHPRLSPLHPQIQQRQQQQAAEEASQAKALSKEAEDIAAGFEDFDNDSKDNDKQQEEEDEEDDDYYSELIKRGQKLHSHVAKEVKPVSEIHKDEGKVQRSLETPLEEPAFLLNPSTKQESTKATAKAQDFKDEEIMDEVDDYEDDFHDDVEDQVDDSSEKKPVRQPVTFDQLKSQPKPQGGSVFFGKQESPQPKKEVEAKPLPSSAAQNKSQTTDDFKDYGDDDDDDVFEEEEEEEVVQPKPKVVFPFKMANPVEKQAEAPLLYGTLTKQDGEGGKTVQIFGQSSAVFNQSKEKPLNNDIEQPKAQLPTANQGSAVFNSQIIPQKQPPLQQLQEKPQPEQPKIDAKQQIPDIKAQEQVKLVNRSATPTSKESDSPIQKPSHSSSRLSGSVKHDISLSQSQQTQKKDSEKVQQPFQYVPPPLKPQTVDKSIQDSPPEHIKGKAALVLDQEQHQKDDKPKSENNSFSLLNEDLLQNIDKLDYQERLKLLKQLFGEYDRNPKQFPFPRDVIKEFVMKGCKDAHDMKDKPKFQGPPTNIVSGEVDYFNEDSSLMMEPNFFENKPRPKSAKTKKGKTSSKNGRPSTAKESRALKSKGPIDKKQSSSKNTNTLSFTSEQNKSKKQFPGQLNDEVLEQMTSEELRQIIKTQQKALSEQEKRYQRMKQLKSITEQQDQKANDKKTQSIINEQKPIEDINLSKQLSYQVKISAPIKKTKKQSYLEKMKPIKTDPKIEENQKRHSRSRSRKESKKLEKSQNRDSFSRSQKRNSSQRNVDYAQNEPKGLSSPQATNKSRSSLQNSVNKANSTQKSKRMISPSGVSQPSIISSIAKDKPSSRVTKDKEALVEINGSGSVNIELSDNQLIQLVKVAETLPRDQQKMLVQVLSEKVNNSKSTASLTSSSGQNYKNLYAKLLETFKKSKQQRSKSPPKSAVPKTLVENEDRLKQQRNQVELLMKQYNQEIKTLERKQAVDEKVQEKRIRRDQKIEALKEKRLFEQIIRQQKSSESAKQLHHERTQLQFMRMAKEIQKKRDYAERAERREYVRESKDKGERIVKMIEGIFNNRVTSLKDKIEQEKYDRMVAQQAQIQVMANMRKELKEERERETERLQQLHRQQRIKEYQQKEAAAVAGVKK